MELNIINPLKYPKWDDLLLTNEKSSFFHTSGWARVLSESYNYKPLYFAQIENNKLTGLIAVMEINSPLTGKRGVSLPFTDHCPPIARDSVTFKEIFSKVVQYGKKAGWKTIELRGGEEYLPDKPASETFLTHTLTLGETEQKIVSTFKSSTRRNIKKAVNKGVEVKVLNSFESMKDFYRLNCLTRKDHGLPPQPFKFFHNIYKYVISTKKCFVVLAQIKQRFVAGAVYFHFGGQILYKYGASDKKYQSHRANNLVMWEAIKMYAVNGSGIFDFGRTELDHKGLVQFKRGWGTEEDVQHYFKYDFSQNDFVRDVPKVKSSYAFFNKMPIPLLKLIGRLLYRHIG